MSIIAFLPLLLSMSPVLQKEMWEAGFKNLGKFDSPWVQIPGWSLLARMISPTFQDKTTSDKVTSHHQRIRKSPQEPIIKGGFAFPDTKTGSRKGRASVFPGLLQQVVPGSEQQPNNKWKLILDLSNLNLYLLTATFKMETPKMIKLSSARREGHLLGLRRDSLPHPNKSKVPEISEVSSEWSQPFPFYEVSSEWSRPFPLA